MSRSPSYDPLRRATDNMYLLMIRDRDGKPLCPKRTMEYALAAALLGDLVICRRILIDQYSRNVLPVTPDDQYRNPPPYQLTELDNEATHMIWSEFPIATAADWLEGLGPFALKQVPSRLASMDFLYYGGPLWARRWRPTDHRAIMPLSSLEYALRKRDVDPTDTLLFGLIEATLLTDVLFWSKDHPTLREDIGKFLRMLPSDLEASIRTLIATVQHKIGNSVLTHA